MKKVSILRHQQTMLENIKLIDCLKKKDKH